MQAQKWDWPLQHADGVVNLVNKRDSFSCDLEMPFFKAKEIDVKVINDDLVLHCSQDIGGDRMPREIHRTYHLPPDVDRASVRTSFANDGLLRVTAKKIED